MRIFFGFLVGFLVSAAVIVSLAFPSRSSPRTKQVVPATENPRPTATAMPPGTTAITPTPETRSTDFELYIVVVLRADNFWTDVLLVENGSVRSLLLPETVDRSVPPITDGTRLYAYDRDRAGRARLVAFSFDGQEEETITDSTPLVEPRGLFASPDGRALAFFLDNRTSRKTELWTYDTVQRTKRVAVEHLSRDRLFGPFFAADGGFLLVAGERILAGSPWRTGADLLRVIFPLATVRWDAGVARSPDGSRLAFVTEQGDGRAVFSRVIEYTLDSGRANIRLAGRGGGMRIVRWRDDELLALTGVDSPLGVGAVQPTAWILRGDQRATVPLGGGVDGDLVSSAGESVAFVRRTTEAATLEVLDTAQGTTRVITGLSDESRIGRTFGTPRGVVRLVQMLQRKVLPEGRIPSSAAEVLRPAAVLEFISRHLRELVDAPPGEYAAPERAWELHTSGLYYVDYRIGSTLWRRLVSARADGGVLAGVSVIGVFAPTEGSWVLTRGQDALDPTPVRLYEFEPELNRWIEKPVLAYSSRSGGTSGGPVPTHSSRSGGTSGDPVPTHSSRSGGTSGGPVGHGGLP